jgi:hypothetical protein
MSSIAPPIDGGEVEVSSRRVGLWKSPGDQIGQRRLELGERFAEAAGGSGGTSRGSMRKRMDY